MTFPAHQLAARVSASGEPFRLKSADGTTYGMVTYGCLAQFIAAGVVCGVGSHRKLRYFQLTVDQQELERISTAVPRRTRVSLPLEFLIRMCADRKFTKREALPVEEQDGRMRMHYVHEHKSVSHRVDAAWAAARELMRVGLEPAGR